MGICQYQRPDKSDVGIFKKIAIRRQAPVEDRFRETGEKDMRYDFTKIIDRHGKDAIAVDGLGKNPGFAPEPPKDGFDVIPMWVADMNFETVPTIPKAIMDRAAHPAYGYFSPVEEYYDSIIRWHKIRNNVEGLMPEYIGYENGVLGGVISALTAFAAPGDAVLLHSPTYIGFTKCITENGYKIVHSPLKKDEKGIWRMDYEDMDAKLKANNIHVAVFCSPHNPTGRVWERWEIEKAMEKVCKELEQKNPDSKNETKAVQDKSDLFGQYVFYHQINENTFREQLKKLDFQVSEKSYRICRMEIANYKEVCEKTKDEQGALIQFLIFNMTEEILGKYKNGELIRENEKIIFF